MDWAKAGKRINPIAVLIGILLLAAFLRLWKIDQAPASLFGDELDVGYHALSILQTARDYSGNLLPIQFQSLAEFRTPLYLYSSVPTVALFGISALGVRLPAVMFGILGVWAIYLLTKKVTGNQVVGLASAALLTISPWHIQYSRAGFEVTEMLFFLMIGMYAFLYAIEHKGKYLWTSAFCLAVLPWIYNSAKLFAPLILIFIVLTWWKSIFSLPKKQLFIAMGVGLLVGLPIAWNTLFGPGGGRFEATSVFSDRTVAQRVIKMRSLEAQSQGVSVTEVSSQIIPRIMYNKYTIAASDIASNMYESVSTDFLFNTGDPNLRHSPAGSGMLYKANIIALVFGFCIFFSKIDRKLKLLLGAWVLAGIMPAALTSDGARHATRLILILPPIMIVLGYGLVVGIRKLPKKWPFLVYFIYFSMLILGVIVHQNNYWRISPIESERYWHAGWKEVVNAIKQNESRYDKVIISTSVEPPLIFFLAHSEYPPALWQKQKNNTAHIEGFGELANIGKYYFGKAEGNMYGWASFLDDKTLYVANASEVGFNLVKKPERIPPDLSLVKAITLTSGSVPFYLFSTAPN